jgi:hypothetical protein
MLVIGVSTRGAGGISRANYLQFCTSDGRPGSDESDDGTPGFDHKGATDDIPDDLSPLGNSEIAALYIP